MILITEFMDAPAVQRLSEAHATEYDPGLADRQGDIPGKTAGVRALIVRNRTQVTADLLDSAGDLVVVGRLGVGLDNIDVDACAARNIEVIPATGANSLSVVEYVLANALILLRGAYQAGPRMMAGEWPRTESSGREIFGRILGLIGYGAIAREAARKAKSLGMTVCAFDPFLPEDSPAWGDTKKLSLEGVLAEADVVILHVPLTDGTRHLINRERLAQMRQGAVLINTARGGVVDDAALADAVRSGHLAGAALDVFETEPLTAEAAKIFDGLSLILTPHIAGVTEESNVRVSEMIAEQVLDRLS